MIGVSSKVPLQKAAVRMETKMPVQFGDPHLKPLKPFLIVQSAKYSGC
jgi:hypothetical protein